MKGPVNRLEAKISELMCKFEMEHMGRGPEDIRTHIIGDMVLVRFKNVLTPAEKSLAKSGGGKLIKDMRRQLLESSRPLLESIIIDIIGEKVLSMHTDVSTRTGERIILFVLAPEKERATK